MSQIWSTQPFNASSFHETTLLPGQHVSSFFHGHSLGFPTRHGARTRRQGESELMQHRSTFPAAFHHTHLHFAIIPPMADARPCFCDKHD